MAERETIGRVKLDLAALVEMSGLLTGSLDPGFIANHIALVLMGKMLIRRVAIFTSRSNNFFFCEHAKGVAVKGALLELNETFESIIPVPDAKEFALLRENNFTLIVPMRLGGKTMGFIACGAKAGAENFSREEQTLLTAIGTIAASSLEAARRADDEVRRKLLEEEIARARTMWERLLPRELPQDPRFSLAARTTPSHEVGGDYFDAIYFRDGRLLLVISDVSGKGLGAAIVMSNVQSCIRTLAPLLENGTLALKECMERVNDVLYLNTDADVFVTMVAAIVDSTNDVLRAVNAGHNSPLLINKEGDVSRIGSTGMIVGVVPNVVYAEELYPFGSESTLMMFTDGASEAVNTEGEQFTEERLEIAARHFKNSSAEKILESITEEIARFRGAASQADDCTFVILCRAS